MAYFKLGEILVKQGIITDDQLKKAIEKQKLDKKRIGETLIKMGFVIEEDIVTALAQQLSIPFCTKDSELLKPRTDQELAKILPFEFAQKNIVLPLSKNMDSLTCAVFDPLDLDLIDNLKKITNCDINLILAGRSTLLQAINNFYIGDKTGDDRSSLLGQAVEKTYLTTSNITLQEDTSFQTLEAELSLDKLVAKAEEAPVIKLVDLIIRQAIDERSSDIHIEPFKDKINLRYRIDGELYQIPPPANHLHLPIVSRIKILARMDIAEKRIPQDGSITARLENRTVDLRISTIPTVWGEKVVMRILDKDAVPLQLAQLGFNSKQVEIIRKSIHKPYGLFFVTGPTGSGKSTTLYAALSECSDPRKNILTVEDPVEFRMEGINQVDIKPEIGLTFANTLRAFLRQDPDIIMVGEVRDLETASICVRAALTGHFVLSSLHTNDAPSAISRLLDIGIEQYLLTPSLTLILAQRLARKLCTRCKEPFEPKPEITGGLQFKSDLIYRAKGCEECNQTGYKGRMVVSEIMQIDEVIREQITKKASYIELRDAARKNGMLTLFESGIEKVEMGITSIDEILSVTTAI